MLKKKINLKTFSPIQLVPEVDQLCRPLKEHLNVKFFNYICSERNRFRFTLSNHKLWFKHYFEKKHYDYEIMSYLNKHPTNYNNISLWDGCRSNHKSCEVYSAIQKDLNVGYILFIFAFYKDHAESFGFGIDNKIPHATQIILNNIDIFKRFSQYFKDAGQNVIQIAREESYQVIVEDKAEYSNPFFWVLDHVAKDKLFKELKVQKIFLKNKHANVFVTLPEAQTVILSVRGFTYNEIAKMLNVSLKTIDYRMEKIRKKLNLGHKKDIINLFVQERYLELIELSI